jgi:hypothetical protein
VSIDFRDSIRSIKYNRPLVSVQDIVKFIRKGEEYLKVGQGELDEQKEMEFLQGIILSPDYQRSYKSTVKEESSIIESLLVGIPIPEIFLVISGDNEMQMRHVMDGQHRLNSIYRYVNNQFPLKNMDILGDNPLYDNKRFSELDKKDKIKILGSHISILEFESFGNPEVEIELFKRYNRNTKPLEIQEIEMATYFSETSKFVSKFINELIERAEETKSFNSTETELDQLFKVYNITKTRNNKQKNHQEICVILNILENGLQENLRDGVMISKNFLKSKAEKYKKGEDESLGQLVLKFDKFNRLLLLISKHVEYPFSSYMIDDQKSKLTKFLLGIAIVMAAISYYFDINYTDERVVLEIRQIIAFSPMANPQYKASTTNIKNVISHLFVINKIQDINFNSIRILDDKRGEIERLILD